MHLDLAAVGRFGRGDDGSARGGVVVHAHALAHFVGECLGSHQAIARQTHGNVLGTEVAVLDALLHEGGDLGFQRFAVGRRRHLGHIDRPGVHLRGGIAGQQALANGAFAHAFQPCQ